MPTALKAVSVEAPLPDENAKLNKFFAKFVNDPRDVVFVRLSLACAGLALLGIGMFFVPMLLAAVDIPPAYFWLIGTAYLLIWGFGLVDRFTLMLHCTSHRKLYNKKYSKLNLIIPWLLCPFFGQTPDTYFVHHMGMHHPENNLMPDLSTTMPYRRDRISHWLIYFFRFFFFSIVELALYHRRKGNKKFMRKIFIGEGGYWLVVGALLFINWQAALVVFVIPLVMIRMLMMAGNWGQHAFVDENDPGNAYRNSITCINSRYNRRCSNDGYHIHHHVYARCHWSEYPIEFQNNVETYAKEDAIVFDGIDFFEVWMRLMFKRYDSLAKHFVQLPGAKVRNHEEVKAFLDSRLGPSRVSAQAGSRATANA